MLGAHLLPTLCGNKQIRKFMETVVKVTDSVTVVGGAVRDAVLSPAAFPNDLDLVVDNSAYAFIVNHLSSQGDLYTYDENRHGNARYTIDDLDDSGDFDLSEFHIDLWCPSRFYQGYADIPQMLEHFDMSINAVGVNLASGDTLDPADGFDDLVEKRVRLLPLQWETDDQQYGYHLVKRLNDLLDRYPELQVVNPHMASNLILKIEEIEKKAQQENDDLFNNLKLLAVPDPVQFHSVSGMPVEKPTEILPGATLSWGPVTSHGEPIKWSEVAAHLYGDMPELKPPKPPEVCAQWAAGEKCPGCKGCPPLASESDEW